MAKTVRSKYAPEIKKDLEEKPFPTPKKEEKYQGAPLFCIKCNDEMEDQGATDGVSHMFPWYGVRIETSGHFGSTAVDSGFGEDCIRFYVCDHCLNDALDRGVAIRFDMKPVSDEDIKKNIRLLAENVVDVLFPE